MSFDINTLSANAQRQITALVPIKGESERVPRKNLRDFCGQPLLMRVLQTLENTACIHKIVVNTDSECVASLAKNMEKTIVHERPQALCGHNVPINHILAYDLKLLGDGHYLQTHVTNPILTSKTIEHAVHTYFQFLDRYDSLFSVTTHQSRFFSADMTPLNHNPQILLNTQDLPPLYEENSCIYLFSSASFFQNGQNRIGENFQLFPINKVESLDIDTEDEFRLAEIAWQAHSSRF